MTRKEDAALYQKTTDICFENVGATKPIIDELMDLIARHTEEAYKKGYIAGGIAQLTNPTEREA